MTTYNYNTQKWVTGRQAWREAARLAILEIRRFRLNGWPDHALTSINNLELFMRAR